jgi:dTMP kinase
MSGKLIVIEGIDGCGKSTQAKLLVDHLVRMNVPYVLAKQPSTGPVGQLLRNILLGLQEDPGARALALLFAADRAHQADRAIRPALERGDVVLCDRYYHSSMAYQTDGSREQALGVRQINAYARVPDMTILLAVDPVLAGARVRARSLAREIFDDEAAQIRVHAAYSSMEEWLHRERIVTIDGEQLPERVHQLILRATDGLI